MEFLTLAEDEFAYGAVDEVLPGVRRVIAENPSKFTYRGTGTYIIGRGDVAVIDPGPELPAHRDALAAALEGETVRSILVTHCHADHSPLAAWLRAETGAPTFAFGPHAAATVGWDVGTLPDDFGRPPEGEEDPKAGVDEADQPKMEEAPDTAFVPDVATATGDEVFAAGGARVTAIHTPGHTSNHTCFAMDDGDRRVLFTGDHVMGWSTTVVSPPDGDMAAYIDSLRRVAGRGDDVAVPTHGPPITDAGTYIEALVAHRLDRERQVLDALGRGLVTIPDMVTDLYAAVWIGLHRPAAFSVLGHLVKLVDEGTVAVVDGGRPRLDATYARV